MENQDERGYVGKREMRGHLDAPGRHSAEEPGERRHMPHASSGSQGKRAGDKGDIPATKEDSGETIKRNADTYQGSINDVRH